MSIKSCSICNADLLLKGDRLVCSRCGSEYLIESYSWDEMPTEFYPSRKQEYSSQTNSNSYSKEYQNFSMGYQDSSYQDSSYQEPTFQNPAFQNNGFQTTPYVDQFGSYDNQNIMMNATQKKREKPEIVPVVVLLSFILFAIVGIKMLFAWVGSSNTRMSQGNTSQGAYSVNSGQGGTNNSQSSTAGSSSSSSERAVAVADTKGTMIEEVVFDAFGKTLDTVTDSELDSVIELYVEPDGYGQLWVKYILETGSTGEFASGYDDMEGALCAVFRNLEVLDLKGISVEKNYLSSLKNLYSLSMKTYSDPSLLCNPQNITRLGLYGGWFSLANISQFENLESLYVRENYSASADVYKKLTNLKELTIMEGGQIDDYTWLYSMSNLEKLYIESSSIKEIGFVGYMPNLTSFGIEGTNVIDISPLEGLKDQLTELYLFENYSITDYSVISSMPNLVELTVKGHSTDNSVLPDLSKATGIKKLYIGNWDVIDTVSNLTQLESLTLDSIYDHDLSELTSLTSLKELMITNGASFEQDMKNISTLTSLERINFDDQFIWADITALFNLPNLKYLNLYRADCGIVPENLNDNLGLEYLNIEKADLYKMKADGSWDYQNEAEYEITEVLQILVHYKNLKDFIMPDSTISSVEQLACLENLEILDIQNTYITDLTPIADLPLRAIFCSNTPIVNAAGFEEQLVTD